MVALDFYKIALESWPAETQGVGGSRALQVAACSSQDPRSLTPQAAAV